MRQYKTRYPGLRVRKQPTTAAAIVGMLREGATIDVEHNVTVGDNIWHALSVSAGGAPLLAADDMGAEGIVYAAHVHTGTQFTDEVVTVPPPKPTTFRTGVWSRTRFDLVDRAFAAGARVALIMDDFAYASSLAARYPDALVMARRFLRDPKAINTASDALNALEGANDPRLVYTLFCEGSDRSIADQARLDIATADAIKAHSGARFAGGTWAMGTPDYTNPAVCAEIKAGYADAYNAGRLLMDMHLYSPDMVHIWQDDALIWYERRWEFLFAKCGFDPRIRGIVCSETGVDQGGVGGFPAHGASGADVARWARRNQEVQQRPIMTYPSPVLGGVLFQLGDQNTGPGGWGGYNVEYALPELSAFWAEGR